MHRNANVSDTGPSSQEKIRMAGIEIQKKFDGEVQNVTSGLLRYNEAIGLCSKTDGIDHKAERLEMTQQIDNLMATLEKVRNLIATTDSSK